nr:L-erythro-3,5-diaminohexanoate dehydrogenase [Clostridioides sp.]
MKGCKYGTHRVIGENELPQPAIKLNNDMNEIYDNEILIDVQALNIDSASFTQIEEECEHDVEKIKSKIQEIVEEKGKMQNPITGSGGMLIGTIEKIGSDLVDKIDIKVGDKIATLVSLSLTPLKIEKILDIKSEIDRVEIIGKAILFESGIYAKLPEDMEENLALAALDVAGAPAQTQKLVKEGDSVLILGGAGKSGMLCCYEARKKAGKSGRVIALVIDDEQAKFIEENAIADSAIAVDAKNPVEVLNKVLEVNEGKEVDLAINCVNVQNTEMSTILPVRNGGVVYFFSMATVFTKAALGAEGVGKDVDMIIGNGYTKGHADVTLTALRESATLRKIFKNLYI